MTPRQKLSLTNLLTRMWDTIFASMQHRKPGTASLVEAAIWPIVTTPALSSPHLPTDLLRLYPFAPTFFLC